MDPFRPPVFVEASKVPASRAAREMRVPSGTVTFFSMIGGLVLVDGRDVSGGGLGWGEQGRRRGEGREL